MTFPVSAFIVLPFILLLGCEVVPGYEAAVGAADTASQSQSAVASDQTTYYETPQPSIDTTYSGSFVAGDEGRDGGEEIFAWVGGMDIRVLANDTAKVSGCVSDFYFISGDLIDATGALTWSGNAFTARNFTSPRSGKKYRFMGWTVEKSANPLITTNPLILNSLRGTLRAYWATVQ